MVGTALYLQRSNLAYCQFSMCVIIVRNFFESQMNTQWRLPIPFVCSLNLVQNCMLTTPGVNYSFACTFVRPFNLKVFVYSLRVEYYSVTNTNMYRALSHTLRLWAFPRCSEFTGVHEGSGSVVFVYGNVIPVAHNFPQTLAYPTVQKCFTHLSYTRQGLVCRAQCF